MGSLTRHKALVVSLLALVGCHEEAISPDLDAFEEMAGRARERAATAVDRARNLQNGDVLSVTNPGRYDIRSFRFTDDLDGAIHSGASLTDRALLEKRNLLCRWSAPAEDVRIVGVQSPLEIELEPIPSKSIGALAVRAAAARGDFVRLGVALRDGEGRQTVAVRIDVIADGLQHEYVVDLRGALDRTSGHTVEWCVISLESGDEAALESLELMSRSWKYGQPWGVTTERIFGVTRPGVYLRNEGVLVWPLAGRWRDARLDFALAEVTPDRRVQVRLELTGVWGRRLVADNEILGGEPWTDRSVALGDVDLDGAVLELSVKHLEGPESDGVLVWGSPVLWEPPEDRLNILVLLEDALRADRMSVYGHFRATTPFKERFFADGVRFET